MLPDTNGRREAAIAGAAAHVPLTQLASLTGLSAQVIRAWERRYGFPSPARTGGGHRRYTRAEVEQVRRAALLVRSGLRAAEAVERARDAAPAAEPGTIAAADLAAQMLDADPAPAFARLRGTALALGFEATLEDVVLPALRLVGEAWAARRLTVAQEHVATGVVVSWLGSVRSELPPVADRSPAYIVATLEGEQHDVAVWALEVLLRSRGIGVRALGASVPAADILEEAGRPGIRGVVIGVRRGDQRRAIGALAARLAALPSAPRLFVGGPAAGDPPAGAEALPATLTAAADHLA